MSNQNQDQITIHNAREFFRYKHLPEHLQKISKPFHDLVVEVLPQLPEGRLRDEFLLSTWKAKNEAVMSLSLPLDKEKK